MAKQYDNNMTGVLFRNDKKKSEKAPDYSGTCEINGEELKIAGWIKEAKSSGKKFISFKFTPADEDAARSGKSGRPAEDESEDDIPF